MKSFLVFLFFLIIFSPSKVSYAEETHYARVLSDNVYFYSSPQESSGLFFLPKTYFVQLQDNAGEDFYSAKYMDLMGYVKKDEVSPIYGTPQTPYPEKLSFRVISLNGLDLRSAPKSNSPFEIVDSVPYLYTDIIYYGSVAGDAMVPDSTTTWYYCKYLKGTSSSTGYLYSLFCDKLSPILANTESFQFNTEELFPELKPIGGSPSNLSFTSPTQILIVVAVSLPCVGIIYLLFKPTKLLKKDEEVKVKKKKIHRLKKSDYYEIDD